MTASWLTGRQGPGLAALAASLVVGTLASGCARATSTPAATPTQAEGVAASGTVGAGSFTVLDAVPSPEPSATFSRPEWPIDEPYPAVLSEQKAADAVLGWLDPGREPRVEWAKAVRRIDLAEAWSGGESLVDQANPGRQIVEPSDLPDVVVAVLASTNGMSLQDGGERDLLSSPCFGMPDDRRESVFVLFDAASGRVVVAMNVYPLLEPLVASVEELPKVAIGGGTSLAQLPTLEPRPSPTPHAAGGASIGAPPDAPALSPDTVPEALRGTFAAWPLLPGNSWSWRVTRRLEGVMWFAATVTETVEAGWIVADDMVLVRSRIAVEPITTDAPLDVRPGTVLRYVTPLGAFPSAAAAGDAALARELGWVGEDGAPAAAVPIEPLHTPLHAEWYDAPPARIAKVEPGMSVTSGAGAYVDCTRYYVLGGRGAGTLRWMCPGTGPVRTEAHTCSPEVGSLTVTDLLRAELEAKVP